MKKSIAIILSIMLVFAITIQAAAISSIAVKSISLNISKITLEAGETSNLKVTFTPANTSQKLLSYTTDNKKIATVDAAGIITGVSAGTTKITVYTPNKKIFAKCNVTVSKSPTVLRITAQAWMFGKYNLVDAGRQFEKDHLGVRVVFNKVDNADTTTNMLQWSMGKTNCDLTLGGSREQAVQYAARDYIINFDNDFFNDKLKKTDFFPAFLELGNIEGTQYMIPMLGEVMYIVVNKTLMKKAGLVDAAGNIKAPATWDELYEYAKKATVIENGKTIQTGLAIDWGTNFMAYSYMSNLQGLKGSIYEADKKTIDFTSKEAKEVMSNWARLVKGGYTSTDSFADMDAGRTNFKAGKVAMHITAASRWVEAGSLLGPDNVTVMPIPGTDKNGSLTYIHGMMIPKLSTAKTLAKTFIMERLLNKEFQTFSVNKYGKMSPLLSDYSAATASQWTAVINATKKAVTSPLYKDFPKLDMAMQVELQKCISGKQSVEDTSENLKKLVDSINKTTGLK